MSISAEDRARLLALARETVVHTVAGGPAARVDQADGVLTEKRGCFVTLTNAGRLRGCLGTFQPRAPLGESVIEMAGMACHDSVVSTRCELACRSGRGNRSRMGIR